MEELNMVEIDRISPSAAPRAVTREQTARPGRESAQAADAPQSSGETPEAQRASENASDTIAKVRAQAVRRTSLGERIQNHIRAQAGGPSAEESDMMSAEGALAEVLTQIIGDRFATRDLRILEDEESGRFVYQSIDRQTGEVVRQFPPEEILNLVSRVREVEGLLLDRNV